MLWDTKMQVDRRKKIDENGQEQRNTLGNRKYEARNASN